MTRFPLLAALLCASVIACSAATPARPPLDVPRGFSASGEQSIPDRWWLAFDDPTLHRLIDVALEGNPGMLATWDRLEQAKASARREGASSIPSLNLDAGGGVSASGRGGTVDGSTSVSLGLAASYEIDLWGSIGAGKDAAAHDVRATEANLKAAAITLSAQVAVTWYDLVQERRQLALLDEQLATATETLEMVELRNDAGAVADTDVLRQRQQVESIRGDRSLATARIRVLENSLAILLGKAPGTALPSSMVLAKLPAMPATGVPAELVTRRPDIVEAFERVQSADRHLAQAIAERFPRLSLSLRASTSASSPQDLFKDWVASLVGNLVQPLIDGGARKAEVDRARAALSERVHAYSGTVLDALGEVEDALVRETRQVDYIASLNDQIALARSTYALTKIAYEAGAADYLRVLDAQSSLQSLERRRVSAEHELIDYRIALYRALAGGWDMTRPNV